MKKLNTKTTITLFMMVAVIALSGCANNEIVKSCVEGHTYGFWGGLWHGLIAPLDFIGMLIWDNIAMYAPNNNGAWYAFGFLIGSGGWGVFLSNSSK